MSGTSDSTEIAVLKTKLEGLRDMMETKLDQIETQLERLQVGFNKLAANGVSGARCESHSQSIAKGLERLDNHQKKLARYDQISRVLNLGWGILSAILVAILIAFATGKAHIVWH